jgi:hypothetical protein
MPCLLAVRAFGEIDVRTDVAATGIWAAVIVFGPKPRQEIDARPYAVKSGEQRVAWECVRQFIEVFVSGVRLNLVREGAADGEVVFVQFMS